MKKLKSMKKIIKRICCGNAGKNKTLEEIVQNNPKK